jgi:hypothetical protein
MSFWQDEDLFGIWLVCKTWSDCVNYNGCLLSFVGRTLVRYVILQGNNSISFATTCKLTPYPYNLDQWGRKMT